MLDLEELEAKAKAAMSANPGVGQWDYDQGHDELNAGGFIVADVWDDACGEFIAAANPAIVLALIRELREARANESRFWIGFAEKAVAAEREACAEVCDTQVHIFEQTAPRESLRPYASKKCADLIRARGEKGSE